ncbi:hypothetical protein [Gordonia sp. NPDC058843]|uniref:hypothetical protein n=1 Tax=Gordonia sp. NPDC058843 TaxID=3346648 RepID=UPI00367EEF52
MAAEALPVEEMLPVAEARAGDRRSGCGRADPRAADVGLETDRPGSVPAAGWGRTHRRRMRDAAAGRPDRAPERGAGRIRPRGYVAWPADEPTGRRCREVGGGRGREAVPGAESGPLAARAASAARGDLAG